MAGGFLKIDEPEAVIVHALGLECLLADKMPVRAAAEYAPVGSAACSAEDSAEDGGVSPPAFAAGPDRLLLQAANAGRKMKTTNRITDFSKGF